MVGFSRVRPLLQRCVTSRHFNAQFKIIWNISRSFDLATSHALTSLKFYGSSWNSSTFSGTPATGPPRMLGRKVRLLLLIVKLQVSWTFKIMLPLSLPFAKSFKVARICYKVKDASTFSLA